VASKHELIAKYLSRVAEKGDIEKLVAAPAAATEAPDTPALRNARKLAAAGVRAIKAGRLPTPEQSASVEAIILPKVRPVLDVVNGDFQTDHPLWLMLNDDDAIRKNLRQAIPSIGRIELPGNPSYPYGGTGFVVGDGLIMTNRHVAAIFSNGIGTRSLSFVPGRRAGIDFKRELNRPTGPILMVKRIVMIHPYWDMALLSVEGLPTESKPLKLSLRDVSADPRIQVAAIGYPAFDPRNNTDVQNDLFHEVFGIKRLQPGTLGGREQTDSFGKSVAAVRHDCSTLGGNSGSALIDFSSGEVVALHFGGRYELTNWGVPSSELALDPRVADAGVTFAGKTSRTDPPWQSWWTQADEGVEPDDISYNSGAGGTQLQSPPPAVPTTTQAISDGVVNLVVPLYISVRLGSPGAAAAATVAGQRQEIVATTEAMVEPEHDTKYSTRTGYDTQFLDKSIKIPMPTPADPSVVATTKDDSTVLHYQNFSIVMHAKRRLALFTASNATAETKLKKPEAGRDYTRKGLSGLGKNDQEKWFIDPRLDEQFQLTDVFYTRDDGAFDKGHIVRREDVAWGKTYAALRRANGDTYHITNCSPQVAGFNRSNLGGDNWGGLENVVLKGAASERYCQFAGPVLDASDQIFLGAAGGKVKVRVKIPSRFWKVVVVQTQEGVASYGFVLEQDLSDVPLELAVPEMFVKYMEPLTDLQKKAGITFPAIVLNADQYDTADGEEMAFRAGAKRRSSAEGTAS
jgi:endonuclease G